MQKNKKLIIVGAGETAEIACEYFTYDSEFKVECFAVHKKYNDKKNFCSLPVENFEEIEKKYSIEDYYVFVAIASDKLNRVRASLYLEAKNKGYKIATYVSSKSFIWRNAKVGENCFIFENNTIQSNVEIGNNVTLWSGNHIGHRTKIKDNCFISSHVVISGFCEIGENTFMGVNSCVADNIKIAKDNFIAMGAVVTKNTEENSIYKGSPAARREVEALNYFVNKK